jgi:prophage tail gpP-like protein
MPSPVPGSWYSVVNGDTTRNISRSAYGIDRSAYLAESNYDLLKDRPISDEGLPTLYQGDKLFIPIYRNKYNDQKITADFDTQLKIVMNGKPLLGAKASRISRAMNQIASGFVFDVPFDHTDKAQVDLFRPYSWYTAQLYIGGELYMTALASKWDYDQAAGTATIEVRTLPGEMIECMGMRKSQTFASGMTLIKVAQEVAKPYGITCYSTDGTGGTVKADGKKDTTSTQYKYDPEGKAVNTDTESAMPRLEQDMDEGDAEFLGRIARDRGFLLTSRPDGNLLICRANTKDKPSCNLVQGEWPVNSVSSSHDGSKRFSKWLGYTDEVGVESPKRELKDTTVPRFRGFAFKASESEEGNLETAVKWRMSKSIAESYGVSVNVDSWRNLDGELWRENMKVTLIAPSVYVFKQTEYIIESVELIKDDNGDTATMRLVIPESYTTTMPKAPFPWEGY